MADSRERRKSLIDLLVELQQARTAFSLLGFSTLGWITAFVLIFVFVFVFMNVLSTGISGESSNVSTVTTAVPIQSNNISYWQTQIINAVGPFGSRCGDETYNVNNVMLATITNGSYTATRRPGSACGLELNTTYFCTNLVIDSYNLAGIKNSFTSNALAVRYMIPEWETVSGGSVRKDNDVRRLIPGDAVFWLTAPNDPGSAKHVSLIASMDIDDLTGNGTLVTNDTNTNLKNNVFFIRNFALIGTWVTGANSPWFGLGPR